jgi:hypothetical protein
MAITMKIEAEFATIPEWMEFISHLNIMGLVSKAATGINSLLPHAAPAEHKPAEHHPLHSNADVLIGRAHGHHEDHENADGHSQALEASALREQKVNAVEQPKTRKPRTPRTEPAPAAKERVYTKDDVDALVGEARQVGVTNVQMGAMLKVLGAQGFANLPTSEYGKFYHVLRAEIEAKKVL